MHIDEYEVFVPADCPALSSSDLDRAKAICNTALQSVLGRDDYIAEHGVDPRFALPDANWSYDAPNEFVRLFRRVSAADPDVIQHLRGFCQVFSGYNLYEYRDGKGTSQSTFRLTDDLSATLATKIKSRGLAFIEEYFQLTDGLNEKHKFSPPRILGECGLVADNIIINNDTCTYQERISILHDAGILEHLERAEQTRGSVRILEIGGGYGALAYWFKTAFPGCSYTIVDLPESLVFSNLYNEIAFPAVPSTFGLRPSPGGFRFVPNYMAEALNEPFDLVINTLSMSEMSQHQVERYIDLLRGSWLAGGGLFFEQNQDNRPAGLLFAQEHFAARFPESVRCGGGEVVFRNGFANIWAMHPIRLNSVSDWSRFRPIVELLEDLGSYNLVRAGRNYFVLRKSLGPTDVLSLDFRDVPGSIFVGHTAEEAKQKIPRTLWR